MKFPCVTVLYNTAWVWGGIPRGESRSQMHFTPASLFVLGEPSTPAETSVSMARAGGRGWMPVVLVRI